MRRDTADHRPPAMGIFAANTREILHKDLRERKPDVSATSKDRLTCLHGILFGKDKKYDEDGADVLKPALENHEWERGPQNSREQK